MPTKPRISPPKTSHPILATIGILALLFFLSIFLAAFLGFASLFGGETVSGNVAVINIKGMIVSDGDSGLFGEAQTSSAQVIKQLHKANADHEIKAIVLEINSGGGYPVASDEIAQAVKDTDKPVVAWIREAGASGAYWVATSSDHIIANRMSVTGSIGVIGSYLDFSGLLADYNVTYQRLVSGEYKDAGSPYRKLTYTEESLLQAKMDRLREIFIQTVADNRNMTYNQVEMYATGMFMLGEEAYKARLVDELGGEREVKEYLEKTYNITAVFVPYTEPSSFADIFGSIMTKQGFAIGRGLSSPLTTTAPLRT